MNFLTPSGLAGMVSGVVAKTASYTVTAADSGKIIAVSPPTVSQVEITFPSVDTLPDNFSVIVMNATSDATAVVLINGDIAELFLQAKQATVVARVGSFLARFCFLVDAANGGSPFPRWDASGGVLELWDNANGMFVPVISSSDATTILGNANGSVQFASSQPVNVLLDFAYEKIYNFPDTTGTVAVLADVGGNGNVVTGTTGTVTAKLGAGVLPFTPTGNLTLNAGLPVTVGSIYAGARASMVITTSGTTSRTITFGTGFKSTGTLATGTVDGKVFTVSFVFDGTSWCETSRTTAM